MSLQRILEDVENERYHQVVRWGVENDDRNTLSDWLSYIKRYTQRAGNAFVSNQRRRLIQIAALAVAAAESCDRNRGFPTGRVSCA